MLIKLRGINYALIFFLFFVNFFFSSWILDIIVTFLTITALLITVPFLEKLPKFLSTIFILCGISISLMNDISFEKTFLSFSNMVGIVVFLGMIPIISLPIRSTNINLNLKPNKNLSNRQAFFLSESLVFSLASLINMAAIPMTSSIMKDKLSVNIQNGHNMLSESLSRGCALAMIWSPIGAGVAVVSELTNLSLISLLPFCLPMAILGVLLDNFIYSLKHKGAMITENPLRQIVNFSFSDITKILIPMLLFMICIAILDELFSLGIMFLITVTSIPFSLLYALLTKKFTEYGINLKIHFKKDVPNMAVQFSMLLAVGFFIKVLENSHYIEAILRAIVDYSNTLGTSGILILTTFSVILISVFGVHPLVAITLMGSIIDPIQLGISPLLFGVILLTSFSLSIMLSPFNGTNNLVSIMTGKSSFLVVKSNLMFSGAFILVIFIFITFINFIN
ncbi:hypothetical protein HNQ94_003057 [Salirhabdus euzebyi]|uniref:Uncharacterized protein n=1 Tax=Salirhabdus euzebyi TaxID=394506 RepID=A0A841Q836_9BACI|nr:hypothetical protein [Salirhabdus euzebyi]MBB6454568.1 hypothetical protein [Salirhabdus euzebyi]